MKTKNTKILTTTVILLLCTGLGTLGLSRRALVQERDLLLAERATLEERAVMLKKGYGEQKALAENSLRARQAAEARAAKANQLVAEQEGKLSTEVTELRGQVEGLEARLAKEHEVQQEQQGATSEAIAQWRAKVEELEGTNRAGQTKIREQEGRISELDTLATSTKAALTSESLQHRSCREKNMTLAGIAQELARNYQRQGVVDLLASNEPLTQLKKVELEKLAQEYLDRIDNKTLPRAGEARP